MFRKHPDKIFKGQKIIGIAYICAQIGGGVLGSFTANIMITDPLCYEGIAQPIVTGYRNFTSMKFTNGSDTNQTMTWTDYAANDTVAQKWISAVISEMMGTFFFVTLFMISTDKATKFSSDKVINCFIIASSYIASRLLSGGQLVTGINNSTYYTPKHYDYYIPDISTSETVGTGTFCNKSSKALFSYHFINTGPLLNPGIALGQMIAAFNFTYIYAYVGPPIAGAIIAGIFYEYVFVKS